MSNTLNKRVAALGFFDGVHSGHAALMHKVLEISKNSNLTPSIVTFDTQPQNIVGLNFIALINSIEDRIGLVERSFGINDIICLPFDIIMATTAWSDFIDRLVIECDIRHFVVGRNFRFGKGATGNSKLLVEKCRDNALGCDVIEDVLYDGIACSSTYIRELLLAGNIELANAFLGHKHVLTDVVRSGQRIGRTIDAPTINMHFAKDVLVPSFGVYATKVYIDENIYNGVTNVGIRPTVDKSGLITAETFIFDFNETLYDCKVRLEFHSFLRPEIKFKNTDDLKEQIKMDCLNAKNYFCDV